MRPLNCLRNLVRFGCSIFFYSRGSARALAVPVAPVPAITRRAHAATFLKLRLTPVARLGIVLHDLTLEDVDLDPDDPVGGLRLGDGIVDVRAQRVQRHPPLAIPLGPGDLGA